MRTPRILPYLVAATAGLIAPFAQAKPPVRVASKELHCSLEVPDGWKRKNDMPKTMWAVLGPLDGGFAPNIVITLAPDNMTALPDEKSFFGDIRKSYENIGTVTAATKTTFQGQPAYSYHAHLHAAGRPDVDNYQIYSVHNARIYILTFTASAALKKKYDPIGEKILASFQFEK